ncbi:hypothetical protein [Streptomyces wuyuanensis]|uniref:hypothetical protein n=1 Tax=Streptomyces wuyuanensis TaxID=1196353 RepID=UPI003D74693F
MVSETHVHNVELTAESLQEDLARLRVQKQALERELAAVVAHLGSVQRALSALQAVMLEPAGATSAGASGATAADRRRAAVPAAPETVAPPSAATDVAPKPTPRGRRPKRRRGAEEAAAKAAANTDRRSGYGRLTEQILEYFATVGDADVRARDVAAALGRDTDSGTINAVRSTLDRLVGSSRIHRVGRGLYRASRS